MNIRWTPHLLAGTFLLVGCGARQVQPDSHTLLVGAHASLERGALVEADQRLDRAQEAGVDNELDRTTLEVLRAETEIRNRAPGQAQARLVPLLEEHPEDPRVHEVAGKAELRLADFPTASKHFAIALRNYTTGFDRARAADLLAVSKGLQAYADGRLDAAHESWARIKDLELRSRVLDAYSVVAPRAAVRPVLPNTYALNITR